MVRILSFTEIGFMTCSENEIEPSEISTQVLTGGTNLLSLFANPTWKTYQLIRCKILNVEMTRGIIQITR